MTDLDYYASRGQIPAWTQSTGAYSTPGLQVSSYARPVPAVHMRTETLRWCRSTVQQPQQQQPKILYNLLMQTEGRTEAVAAGHRSRIRILRFFLHF